MTSPILDVQNRLRTSLSRTKAFQDFTGEGQAASLLRIHRDGLPPSANPKGYTRAELDNLRPYAVIGAPATDAVLRYESAGAFEEWIAIGMMDVLLVKGLTDTQIQQGIEAQIKPIHDIAGRIIQSGDAANPGLVELLQANPGDNFRFRADPRPQVMGTTLNEPEKAEQHGDETFTWIRFTYGG